LHGIDIKMTWEYIAGFFDGEGAVVASMGRERAEIVMSITQADKKILETIQQFLSSQGISARIHPHTDSPWSRKKSWVLMLSTTQALNTLGMLLPHLHVKKALVQDILRFRKMFPLGLRPCTPQFWKKGIRYAFLMVCLLLGIGISLFAAPKPHRPSWALFPGFPPPPTQIDLTFQVKGILPLANGGTGLAAVPGTTGQLIFNNGGVYGAEDPIVSGPDAVGVTPTKNPVQIGCLFLTAPATLTNNQVGAVQCDATQHLLVNPGSGTFTIGGTVSVNALPTGSNTIGKVDILGNAGAIMDAAGQNAASPANELLIAGQFNTSPTTITSGNVSPVQLDNAGSLLVHITAGAGSGGTALADEATFTQGTTNFTPSGCFFNNSITNLTSGQGGAVQCTADRNFFVNVNKWAGSALGAMANYGTSPGAVLVPGMNAFITNVPAVSQSGNWTSRIVGNAGGILDAAGQNAASPANELLTGCQFNTSPTTITSGNISPVQCDNAGSVNVHITAGAGSGGTALADKATFTEGTTQLTPIGGEFNSSSSNLTTGQAGIARMTNDRNLMSDVEKFGGTAISTGTGTGGAGIPRVTVSSDSFPATQAVSGTVTANQGGAPWSVVGTLTNNNAAPGANNVGVLPARAETSAPSYTTGNQALLSEDLSGNLRVSLTGTNTVSGTVTANIGTTNGLALDATLANTQVVENTTTAPTKINVVGGETNDATAQYDAIPLGAGGRSVIVEGFSGGTAVPVSGTVTANQGSANATPWNENVAQFGGTNVVTGTGASGAGIPRVTVSNDSNVLATQSGTWNVNQAIGVAGFGKVTDGSNTAAVKAASTAAVAADPALVVQLSPNQPNLTTPLNVTTTGATTPSDAFANPTTAQVSQGFLMAYNGSTWDRVRTAGIGNNVVSTGLSASAPYGQFNTTLPSLQNGNFSANQMDANGRLFTSDSQTQALLAAMYVTATKPGASNANFIRGTFGRPITSTGDALDVNSKYPAPLAVPSASASNALTPFRNGAVTTAVTVKSAPGNLWAWFVYNPNASACFLDFFNTTSPTLGTTVPVWTISLPATSAANVPPGQFAFVNFSSGWSVAAVTATGGASTCATGVVVSLSIF
jgi:hypothetical protein